MGQALYRKYRSKSLQEVVGQEHITKTLEQALKSGRLSHAYLFTGPRGVGKTSIARILAHDINGLPYDDEQSHIDIIEIDAASNRRIDEIRDLREKVSVAPALAKYKVYIIDEVHMLTREAFNALLKTLEEPPAHVVFILATTEAHKLPETIVSRTQRFVFRPIDEAKVVEHLRHIAKQEKIKVDDAALKLIAQHGEGSFRDSISLLDQASGRGQQITEDTVRDMLGVPSEEAIVSVLNDLATAASPSQLVNDLNALFSRGVPATTIAKQLAQTLRQQLIEGTHHLPQGQIMQLLEQLLEVPVSHDPERYLEVILLGALPISAPVAAPAPVIKPTTATPEPPAQPKASPSDKKPAKKAAAKPAAPPPAAATDGGPHAAVVLDEAIWTQVINALKKDRNTLYGIIRMAKPDFSRPGTLGLTFAFAFHQKRMNEAKNQQLVVAAVKVLTGGTVSIECSLDPGLKLAAPKSKPALPELPPQPAASPEALATISNIFGGGELLQS